MELHSLAIDTDKHTRLQKKITFLVIVYLIVERITTCRLVSLIPSFLRLFCFINTVMTRFEAGWHSSPGRSYVYSGTTVAYSLFNCKIDGIVPGVSAAVVPVWVLMYGAPRLSSAVIGRIEHWR